MREAEDQIWSEIEGASYIRMDIHNSALESLQENYVELLGRAETLTCENIDLICRVKELEAELKYTNETPKGE